MLIVKTCFFMFVHFSWSCFQGCLSQSKNPGSNPASEDTLVKSTYVCFPPTHPCTRSYVGLSSSCLLWVGQEVNKHLLLHKYFCPPQYIKKNIHNLYFEIGKLITMICVLHKVIQTLLTTNLTTSSIENNGIIRYLRIVRYSTSDIWLPNPSIGIQKKILNMCYLQTSKNCFSSCGCVKFHFHILNTFTKKVLTKTSCALRETESSLVKLLKSKSKVVPQRPSKTLLKSK